MANSLSSIGVFDSGIGGLTVYKALRKHCPKADIIYLGDTARLPYGSKSPSTIKRYLNQNVDILRSRGVDAIVVACNSASTVLDSTDFDFPVYGVIIPGSKNAIELTLTKKIGVLATKATVASENYTKTIKAVDSSIMVIEQACPLLVPLVEEGMLHDPITIEMINRYTLPLLDQGVDTLILGCTHYPVLKEVIIGQIGNEVRLVDSADCIGKIFSNYTIDGEGRSQFLLSDSSPGFLTMANFILEENIGKVENIDI